MDKIIKDNNGKWVIRLGLITALLFMFAGIFSFCIGIWLLGILSYIAAIGMVQMILLFIIVKILLMKKK